MMHGRDIADYPDLCKEIADSMKKHVVDPLPANASPELVTWSKSYEEVKAEVQNIIEGKVPPNTWKYTAPSGPVVVPPATISPTATTAPASIPPAGGEAPGNGESMTQRRSRESRKSRIEQRISGHQWDYEFRIELRIKN